MATVLPLSLWSSHVLLFKVPESLLEAKGKFRWESELWAGVSLERKDLEDLLNCHLPCLLEA